MRQSRAPETFRVKSFGCQMNVYDGERMAELLADKGMRAAPEGEDADLVVLNTCHIREKAAEKVYSDIGRLVKAGGDTPPMIAVAGCVAQAEGEEIMARAPSGRPGGRPAGLSPPARDDRARRRAASARPTPTCRRTPSSPRCPSGAARDRARS